MKLMENATVLKHGEELGKKCFPEGQAEIACSKILLCSVVVSIF